MDSKELRKKLKDYHEYPEDPLDMSHSARVLYKLHESDKYFRKRDYSHAVHELLQAKLVNENDYSKEDKMNDYVGIGRRANKFLKVIDNPKTKLDENKRKSWRNIIKEILGKT